jgi:lipopolysaccharide transport system ATP-binding protein
LEVGTGFHPELTGRENIFLNGAILGMRKAEIRAKFDEIVDFSGCGRYVDTPVKRYSSGMYVRLAFAVAAHLEPEILIVDEVLAVGDAQFQTKCLGKMKDVAGEGRTVLFVSHNMSAVKSLTSRAILMHHGKVAADGPVEETYSKYIGMATSMDGNKSYIRGQGKHASITGVKLISESGDETGIYISGTKFILEIEIMTDGTSGMSLEVFLKDANKTRIAMASLHQFQGMSLPATPGLYTCRLKLARMAIAGGDYSLDIATSRVNIGWDHQANDVFSFTVPPSNPNGRPWEFLFSGGYGSLAWLTEDVPEFRASTNS